MCTCAYIQGSSNLLNITSNIADYVALRLTRRAEKRQIIITDDKVASIIDGNIAEVISENYFVS